MSYSYTITLPVGNVTIPVTGVSGSVLTMNTGARGNGSWANPVMSVSQKATIDLKGEEADIIINGVSLAKTLQGIQDRLNILVPDPDLLEKYETLRELHSQYKMMEALLMDSKKK
jgi:hypothetical protein